MNMYTVLGGKVSLFACGKPYTGFRLDQSVDSLCDRAAAIMSELCIGKKGFVPNLRPASRVVLPSDQFEERIVHDKVIAYGKEADGVCITRGEAVIMATGDCPVVVFTIPGESKAVVVHAGRKSLLGELSSGLIGRRESVIAHGLAHFDKGEYDKVFAYVVVGIGRNSFLHSPNDPVWGEGNKKLLRHIERLYGRHCIDWNTGALSLHEIIRSQCVQSGLVEGSVRLDGVDTYTDRASNGDYAWWSHKRGDRNRNSIIVKV